MEDLLSYDNHIDHVINNCLLTVKVPSASRYSQKSSWLKSDFIDRICARYDGIPLDTLLEDIRATKPYAAVQNALKK